MFYCPDVLLLSPNFLPMDFQHDKARYLNLSLEEKRSEYHCKSKFVTLDNIPSWSQYSGNVHDAQITSEYPKNQSLNEKVSIFVGDITALEVDAIVNASNSALIADKGVDSAIHVAAGPKLFAECVTLSGCLAGEAKITGGYKLPAKYVIHTVGPVGEKSDILQNCYHNSLKVAKENGVKTIAFSCISTGCRHYPNRNAAHVALRTVRLFLEGNGYSFDRVIFCLFHPLDVSIYENLLQEYFPV